MKQYKIKAMFKSEQEKKAGEVLYEILEERGNSVLIAPLNFDWDIVPSEQVMRYMIEEAI
jgi:hypothetical protein